MAFAQNANESQASFAQNTKECYWQVLRLLKDDSPMATPRELVEVVAGHLGVPVATVVLHDRNLSLAGLRTMAGRGRAAAQVRAFDAANLLIAVAASRNVKDSAVTVLAYLRLLRIPNDGMSEETRARAEMKPVESFGERLAWSLSSSGQEVIGKKGSVSVSFEGPFAEARLSFVIDSRTSWSERFTVTGSPFDDRGRGERNDLTYGSKFSEITLRAVAQCINGS